MYTATISMQPSTSIPHTPEPSIVQGTYGVGSNKQNLSTLRQSPYFSRDLLQQAPNGGSRANLREEAHKSSQKRTRFQDPEELKRKSSLSTDTEIDTFELPSDLEASTDVDRLLETVSSPFKFSVFENGSNVQL